MLIILNGSALLAKPDDINNTTWQQKSDLIQNYPVICATNFEHGVQLFIEDVLNRGYYMAAWGYEFYLRVLQVSLSAREDKIRIPKWPCNVLFIIKILMKCLDLKTTCFIHFRNDEKVVTNR